MEKTCPGWTGLSPARATLPYPHLYSWKKLWVVIGTLSKDDDYGSENVAKKWICTLWNLIASIRTRSICQMQAIFPRLKFLRILFTGSKRGRKIRRRMSTTSIKRQIRRFHVVVVQWTSKKCTKKRDARAELLFWSLNLLFFEVVVVVVVVTEAP